MFLNRTVLSFQSLVSTPSPTTLGSLIKTYFWVIYLHETGVEMEMHQITRAALYACYFFICRQKLQKIIVNYKVRKNLNTWGKLIR